MKRRCWKILAFLSALFVSFVFTVSVEGQKGDAQPKQPKAPEIVLDERIGRSIAKGQLLVTLHKGVKADDLKPIFERMEVKCEIVDRIESMNHYTLATDHERLPEIKQRLENHPYVASAAFNGVSSVERVFNDPVFKKPKDMQEDKDNWNIFRINAPDAWDITMGGALVAVIDTGAVLDHEDLLERTTNPFSYATNSTSMQTGMKKLKRGEKQYSNEEIRNHGTHVSITIGGKADNGVGTVGIAPNSLIMPLQALIYRHAFPDEDAGTLSGNDSDITRAMALAVDRNAAVINMSLGGVNPELLKEWRAAKTELEKQDVGAKLLARADDHLKVLAPFLDRANRAGTIVVVAALNDNIPAEFGAYSLSRRTISVAATTREDKRANFSNYGSYTTVSAPGKDIWSGFAEEGKPYSYMSGTSMACPHAAGVVALMKTIDPGLKHADVAAILIRTGRTLDTDQPIGPLINAKAALEEVRRRLTLNIREAEPPPLVAPPDANPTQPRLPEDGIDILRRPNPWNNPDVRRIIQVWLTFATPRAPVGGDPTLRWFFNGNGQVVNNRTALTTQRPVWFRFNNRWLLENAQMLDSTNMGTLNEFVVGTLRSGTFNSAPPRVPENFRPRKTDPQPRTGGWPLDPGLAKTKWDGKNAKGDSAKFEFDDKGVTITRDGKPVRYAVRFNSYAHPMTIDFYPEKGGDPIRGLLQMTDLGEMSLRTDFTKTRPTTISHGDPLTYSVKRTDISGNARGFVEADGKEIDPRFADATVSDGTTDCAADVGTFAGSTGSAGPRTAIASMKLAKGIPVVGHYWVIRKFTDAAGPTQFIAKSAKDPRYTVKTFDNGMAGFIVVARDIAADHLKDTNEAYAKVGKPFEQSSHTHMFIYRETFLVTYSLWEGKRGHDFSAESKRITEKSKKLIDDRFPPQ